MAKKSSITNHKPSPLHLNCRIADIKPDPYHAGRRIVSVSFDDGKPEGPWFQAFSVIPDQVITIDDFINKLMTMPIERPIDPFQNISKVFDKNETFVLDLTAKIDSTGDNVT